MGLLDDAIREHLDLKRRRGGDPAEIERAAREALGPVRRNRDPGLSDEADDAPETRYAPVGSAQDEPDEGVAADLAEEPDFDAEPVTGDLTADDPFADDDAEADGERAEVDGGDAPATRVMRPADIPEPMQRTAEYDVQEAFAAGEDEPFAPEPTAQPVTGDEGGEDEDVLEETPEFLQDTPDHDRLWFEQRPPRDFDFDG
jgi:hypothetical protein